MTTSLTRTGHLFEAIVDLHAIAHNTELIARHTAAAVMAVVKADGFGHGMVPVARTVLAHGASWLGVTSCAEALELRAAGISAPVLSWLHCHDEDFGPAIRADIDLSASSVQHLTRIAACAERNDTVANVHLKVDTGLCRNGSPAREWPTLLSLARRLERHGTIRVRGVWSHLASAGQPGHASVRAQIRHFDEALALAGRIGLDPQLRHLANSAAALGAPATHYNLVRPGIGLYGVEPVAGRTFGLRGALTLQARTIMVKDVPAATGISYDYEYVTAEAGRVALVPLGYADGIPPQVSGRAEVWLAGRRRAIVGRIAMDQFVVHLGRDSAELGDRVLLIGPGDDGEPTVTEWARWAGTIPHQILTGIGRRVPRRHVGESTEGRELCLG